MSLVPPIILELRAKAGEVYTELGKVQTETKKMVSETEGGSTKMQAAYKGAAGAGKAITLGIAGAAIAVGGFSLEAASSAQVVEAKLNVSLKNAGSSFEELKPKIEAADDAGRKYGFTNDQTNTALATLTTALGDPKKALADLSIAQDLSKQKNIDLASAAILVAKTAEGQSRGLKALGIDLPVASANAAQVAKAQQQLAAAQDKANQILQQSPNAVNASSKAHKAYEAALAKVQAAQQAVTDKASAGGQMLAALKSKVSGAASAYGDTFAGKIASARAGVEAMGEKLGAILIPMIEKAITVGQGFVAFLQKNPPLLYTLIGIIGGVLVLAIGAYISTLIMAGVENVKLMASEIKKGAVFLASKAAIVGSTVATLAQSAASKAAAVASGIAMSAQKAWTVVQFLAKASTLEYIGAMVAQKAALVAGAIATGVMTAAQWAFNVAADANPIGLIILAIAALIGIIILVVTHWKQVTEFLASAWKNVGDFFKTIGDAIAKWWNGFWGGITGFVTNLWKKEVKGWTIVFQWLHDTLVGIGTNISNWWNGLWAGIVKFVQDVWKGAANGIIGFFNGLIDTVDGLIGGLNTVLAGIKTISGGSINLQIGKIPHLPSFDVGGTVPGPLGAPSLAVVHGGEPILSNAMMAGRAPIPKNVTDAVNRQQGSRGGANTYGDINVYAQTNATPAHIASSVGWELRRRG